MVDLVARRTRGSRDSSARRVSLPSARRLADRAACRGSPTAGRRPFIQLTEGVVPTRSWPSGAPMEAELEDAARRRRVWTLRRPPAGLRIDAGTSARRPTGRVRVGRGAALGAAGASASPASARATACAFDQAGRAVRLGADRRYTGPDCPPEMLEVGGIPQGDYVPVPWLLVERGLRALARDATATARCSTLGSASRRRRPRARRPGRSAARVHRSRRRRRGCAATCALTGLPALLPEWAYGHWKSPRRLRAPARRRGRLRGLPRATACRSTRS